MKTVAKIITVIVGMVIGYQASYFLFETGIIDRLFNIQVVSPANYIASSVFAVVCGVLLLILMPYIMSSFNKFSSSQIKRLRNYSTWDLVLGIIGLIVGLVIALLLSILISNLVIPNLFKNILSIAVYLVLAYMGTALALTKRGEIQGMFRSIGEGKDRERDSKKAKQTQDSGIKILDTSAIIDGRILDIFKSGFVDGAIIVPEFVLTELRHVADSADDLKRQRGRRGLDILNRLQSELPIEVSVVDKDYSHIDEVDAKLVKLAFDMGAKIVTNDFNLNKIAQFQGVSVLNVNELANAVKTVLLPGEELEILILKEGKESNQGVGYLDDGTMIVVQGGKRFIGENKAIMVTSVLQTAAGKMVFAKPK